METDTRALADSLSPCADNILSPAQSLSQDMPLPKQYSTITGQTVPWKEDPTNPHNWAQSQKYVNTILLSALTFNTLMSSTMVAPALSQIRDDLNIGSDTQTQLVLSIFVLSYAVGYFIWAPLSEVYGRKKILQIANLWFLIWNLVCGFARNEATITTGRLFSGAGAAASLALGSGTMGEIWRPAQRGRSLAVLSLITNLGPAVGPIIGGAIAEQSASSWRWAFWSTSMFNGCLQLLSLRYLHESHQETITRRTKPRLDEERRTKEHRTIQVLITAFKRPFYLLLTYPASQGLAVYTCFTFGTLYILLSLIPAAFTTIHGQSILIASLNYLAFGVGTTFGAQVCAPIIDCLYRRRAKQTTEQMSTVGEAEESLRRTASCSVAPELRLCPFVPTILLMSAGLLVFGWTLQFRLHWMTTNVGIFIFGAGNQAMTQCTNAYTIDIFSEIKIPNKGSSPKSSTNHCNVQRNQEEKPGSSVKTDMNVQLSETSFSSVNWSASAMASIWAAKSLGGFAFPLFGVDMVSHLGWGWAGTLLAITNLAIGMPLAIGLLIWGGKLRTVGEKRMSEKLNAGEM